MPTIEDRLRQWQQELLDFSNRNTLLNFRPSTSKPSTIELIAPVSAEIYDTLRKGRSLTVLGNDPPEDDVADEDDEEKRDDEQAQQGLTEITDDAPQAEVVPPSVRPGAVLASLQSEHTGFFCVSPPEPEGLNWNRASIPSSPSSGS